MARAKPADSYIPPLAFALFLILVVFAPFKVVMGAVIVVPLLALAFTAFFSFTRPDKA